MRLVATFGVLLAVVLLTVSCAGVSTPDAEATAAAATAAAVAAVTTPTPAPTDTPLPTDTPAPTLTLAPPTDTPEPSPSPEPTAVPAAPPSDTPAPTDTPIPEMLAAPVLLAPADGDTFAGIATDVTLSWSAASRELAEDEYYVLLITHQEGIDYTWTKNTSFSITQNKPWLGELGPELQWQVVIARRTAEQLDDNPAGMETSDYSLIWVCYWNI